MGRPLLDLDPRPPHGWQPEPLELPVDLPTPARPDRARRDEAPDDDAPPGSVVIVIDLA